MGRRQGIIGIAPPLAIGGGEGSELQRRDLRTAGNDGSDTLPAHSDMHRGGRSRNRFEQRHAQHHV